MNVDVARPGARKPPLLAMFGMRRSGNHAIADWLRRNVPGECVFLNDCAPGDPFETYALMETPRGDRHGPSFRTTRWFPQFPDGRNARAHLVSYEDRLPGTATPEGWGRPATEIVVHRSFLNWLASFLKLVRVRKAGTAQGARGMGPLRRAVSQYVALLTACEGRVSLSLDRWRQDADYRARRLDALRLPMLDNEVGTQARYGGGSSFSPGHAAPGASDLSSRWRIAATDPIFRTIAGAAGRSPGLLDVLNRHYPEDVARLRRIAGDTAWTPRTLSWCN
ncbi:hypothetical protein RM543_03540 [Roseicyclus sp. F158]|uniref:Sulfotransferase family protein n=1 Tax=Tropicimonas omnivorans TaxID=3075590 RepID=A0ABU3DF48_9RHOB|nr:hypothetical protein [Roseicyclus sp. F158]MDT0681747.1 hypothetical protein [Roseicyclus sp. F158]